MTKRGQPSPEIPRDVKSSAIGKKARAAPRLSIRNELRLGRLGLCSGRLSVLEPSRRAARALFLIVATVSLAVAVIVGFRWQSGLEISALSLALPVLALGWLTLLGVQVQRHREPTAEAGPSAERPSRRPPQWDALPNANRKSNHPGPPGGQVSA